ncbi:class I SAM-dependent methyltransferase [Yoonia sp. SS1-5]|uniref:Class I SAM-dependent methyltransferase n=1 Tax=Yoonia rhodophyticola TaxID=3137370 RepID=A0AAN0M9Q3_9RHOB
MSIDRQPYDPDILASRYDRQSDSWHAMIQHHGFEQAYERLIARIFRQPRYQQPTGNLRVLDAGIGTGAMTEAFHRCIGRRFEAAGVDISTGMLRAAAARLGQLGMDVSLAKADLTALPYADDSFDVVLAAHVIEHLPQPQQAIAEIFRVLRPGGILICCITRQSSTGAYIQLKWRTHKADTPTAIGWLRHGGLTSVRAIPLDKQSATRRFSIGYVGRKPLVD